MRTQRSVRPLGLSKVVSVPITASDAQSGDVDKVVIAASSVRRIVVPRIGDITRGRLQRAAHQ